VILQTIGNFVLGCVGEYLGIPYALPVLSPEAKGTNLLHGVNYASAGAGILEETGSIFVRNSSYFPLGDHCHCPAITKSPLSK